MVWDPSHPTPNPKLTDKMVFQMGNNRLGNTAGGTSLVVKKEES